MSGDLVALAREYVALSDQLEAVRAKIKATVLNGSAPDAKAEPAVNFPQPRVRAKRTPKNPHPNAIKFAETSEAILSQLRLKPSSTTEIAAATQAKTSTTVERLRRLTERGLVQRDEQGLYSAV